MTRGQIQMGALAILGALLVVGSLTYIVVARPAYLRATLYGVPYYTPQAINPVTNQPVDVNTLARHYVGH